MSLREVEWAVLHHTSFRGACKECFKRNWEEGGECGDLMAVASQLFSFLHCIPRWTKRVVSRWRGQKIHWTRLDPSCAFQNCFWLSMYIRLPGGSLLKSWLDGFQFRVSGGLVFQSYNIVTSFWFLGGLKIVLESTRVRQVVEKMCVVSEFMADQYIMEMQECILGWFSHSVHVRLFKRVMSM